MAPIRARVLRGEKQLGTFGERGGLMRFSIDAAPDPSRVAFDLMKLAGYLEETGPPMRAAARIGQEDMKRHFDTDSDPEGNEWLPLDPEYLKKKAKMPELKTQPDNILTLSTELERKATSPAAWIATENSLFFSTKGLPPYWDVHQSGSDPHGLSGYAADVRLRAVNKEQHPDDPKGGKHSNMDIGRGQATPARPFIGLSTEAQNQIVELFDLWFDEGIVLSINPKTGIVQQRVGGRFGKKMFPNFGD